MRRIQSPHGIRAEVCLMRWIKCTFQTERDRDRFYRSTVAIRHSNDDLNSVERYDRRRAGEWHLVWDVLIDEEQFPFKKYFPKDMPFPLVLFIEPPEDLPEDPHRLHLVVRDEAGNMAYVKVWPDRELTPLSKLPAATGAGSKNRTP